MKAGTKVRLGVAMMVAAAIMGGAFAQVALAQDQTGTAEDEKVTFTVGQVNDAITFNRCSPSRRPSTTRWTWRTTPS